MLIFLCVISLLKHQQVNGYYTYTVHTQLQLKRDTRGTCKDHARYTRAFLLYTHKYTQCHLPACIGLHASSLLVYMQSSFCNATPRMRVYRVNTVNGQGTHNQINTLIHVYGLVLEYTVVLNNSFSASQ